MGDIVNLYLVKRLLFTTLSLFVILSLVFAITTMLPGNAADMILGQQATDERIEQVEEELGLDRPLHVQYTDWVTNVVTGEWGTSYFSGKPVEEQIWPRFVRSIQLTALSMLLILLIAIPLGVVAAANRDTVIESIISYAAYVGVSIPEFVTGTLLLLVFTGPPHELFPSGGYVPLREGILPWLHHLALPAITLTILLTAHVMRQTRASMIQALQSEYVRTARLKGQTEIRVLFKHALRNGLLPTITVMALNFGWLMGGLVIVEEVFTFPGLGRLIIQAIQDRDLPLIQMAILIPTAAYIFANLVADLLYTYLDPKIEYGDQ